MRPLLILLPLLTACAVTAENFGERYADAQCERTQECDLGLFEDAYDDDFEECVTSWTAAWAVSAAECDFDKEKADLCLESLHNDTCGDLVDGADGCAEVFVCDSGDVAGR